MLRTELDRHTDVGEQEQTWRVSSGSAVVLGLAEARLDAAPTTAYLMLGDRCLRDCAFCAQARSSGSSPAALSRVMWPEYPAPQAVDAIDAGYRDGRIARACFQVTACVGAVDQSLDAVRELAASTPIPICVSVAPRNLDDVDALLAAGAERVTIALDAACERIYRAVKGGSWARTLNLLAESATRHPGHVGTHLIVGLGETEQEMAERIQWTYDRGIVAGLFALTPVSGTRMADAAPPTLDCYRRMQAARHLIYGGQARAERFTFDDDGRLAGYGLSADELRSALGDGTAFRTSGCPGCNRPYYNERPGGTMYNYARPLSPEEAAHELAKLLAHIAPS